MGTQRVLQATVLGLLIAGLPGLAVAGPWGNRMGGPLAKPKSKEPVAVIDLGPSNAVSDVSDGQIRQRLAASVVAAGLEPLLGEGVEDALAGVDVPRDALALEAALAGAANAFGQLDCPATLASTQIAIPLLAGRQAAGLAVPELPRAWAYVLLCADRTGDTSAAIRAAAMLRTIGGSPDVSPAIVSKYPTVDPSLGNDTIPLDVTTEVAGATVYVDFAPVTQSSGSPVHVTLSPGEHVIAAASGSRRGTIVGKPVASQTSITIPMPDQAGRWSDVATRVASWHGKLPSAAELGWVLDRVKVRAALIRHGDTVEVWGHAGGSEPLRRLGNDDGIRPLSEADHATALLADRVAGWNEHAPDPDQPLLVEDIHQRAKRLSGQPDEPARWWVYAAIGAAAVAGAIVIYAHETESDTQRVELHYP